MALYSKICGSELIRRGLNNALDRVRRFSRKNEKNKNKNMKNMILRARPGSEPIIIYKPSLAEPNSVWLEQKIEKSKFMLSFN